MNLQTFKAATMAEALTQVKSNMGSDAVILHTRTFYTRHWLGLRRREMVEITAGKGLNVGRRRFVAEPAPSAKPTRVTGGGLAAYRSGGGDRERALAPVGASRVGGGGAGKALMETPAAVSTLLPERYAASPTPLVRVGCADGAGSATNRRRPTFSPLPAVISTISRRRNPSQWRV